MPVYKELLLAGFDSDNLESSGDRLSKEYYE